jgi:carbamoyl-phosphate synthase large subunit
MEQYWKGKRVFISGGNGVIGNALVERLHGLGARLYVGDLKPQPLGWPKDVIYRQGDLNYITEQELQAFGPEVFIHLAATFERSTETYEFWEENYWHNVRLSHHLMTSLKDVPTLKRVAFASSYLIYDPSLYNFPEAQTQAYSLRETDPIYPRNLTGVAKLNHEIELRFLEEFRGGQYTSVMARIYRVYGKYSRDVVSRWVRSLLKGETLSVYRPEGIFDYIYAGDVAEGLLRLVQTDYKGVVNLGTGNSRPVQHVLDVLKTHFPAMQTVDIDAEANIPYEASQADVSLLKQLTGWSPTRTLEEMIPVLIEHESATPYDATQTQARFSILVSSASKKVPLLHAVQAASKKLGNAGKVWACDANEQARTRRFADAFWKMPRLDVLTTEVLIDFCNKNGIRAIVPTRDGELHWFAERKHELERAGIAVMVPDSEAVQTCLDKLKFAEVLAAKGFPAIPTYSIVPADAQHDSRWVVKERFGAGALSIGLNLTSEEAEEHIQDLNQPIVQPFIAGKEVSVDAYFTRTGACKGVVVRSRAVIENGESQETVTLRHPELEDMMVRLGSALGLYGHCILQAILLADGSIQIIELNSRFGGASTLSIAAGLDSFYWFLLEAQRLDIEPYPFHRAPNNLRQVRYPADIVIQDQPES